LLFQIQLVPLHLGAISKVQGANHRKVPKFHVLFTTFEYADDPVRLYKLRIQFTHSLQAPGFNPEAIT
jgi:hypothetical protein